MKETIQTRLKYALNFVPVSCAASDAINEAIEHIDRLAIACETVVHQLSPSVVDIVIKPGCEPYAVKLCREAIAQAKKS